MKPLKRRGIAANPGVIADNEAAARAAFEKGDYVLCYLLEHALVESLLRTYLDDWRDGEHFSDLIEDYCARQRAERQPQAEFKEELTAFNYRRNRVVHSLSRVGYTKVNHGKNLRGACQAGMIMYGLFIEWLETFDQSITEVGYHYDT